MGVAQSTASSRADFIASEAETPEQVVAQNIEVATDIEVMQSIPQHFEITDDKSANWLVKRIMESRAYARKVKDWAEQELRRAEREETTLMFLYGRQISDWTRDEVAKLNGRRKSLCLPAGTIGFRSTSTRILVEDEASVLTWAKENLPAAVIVAERLSRTVINEYAERTGVIPDHGVRIEPAGQKFFIR